MKHNCKICGKPSLFFIWSTSRVFNREKFLDYCRTRNRTMSKEEEQEIMNKSYIVCQFCLHQENLI